MALANELIIGSRIGANKKNRKRPIKFCKSTKNHWTTGLAAPSATPPRGYITAAFAASALAKAPAPACKFCVNC